jgi:DNA mismatch repair protein MutS
VKVKENGSVETPLMKQYNSIKAKYPDAILLFRVGDFYETFSADAVKTANILGIVLTRRANGAASFVELAGFPHHALDTYLPKLVRAGYRVAICDQLEDPKATKTIVKRGVTELISPGVAYSDKILDHRSNNFLASLYFEDSKAGISFLDISTGEFLISEGSQEYIDKLLHSFKPTEVIYQKSRKKLTEDVLGGKFYTYGLEDWVFATDYANELLNRHFGTKNLKGFGIEDHRLGIIAASAALHYLSENQIEKLAHVHSVARIENDKYVWLDKFTVRNLELVGSHNENATTLIDILDQTITPMGARLLKRWIMLPLKDVKAIENRLQVVNYFAHNTEQTEEIIQLIKQIGDLERLISKVALGKINPRELAQIRRALSAIALIKEWCLKSGNINLSKTGEQLNPCALIRSRIEKELVSEPSVQLNKGNVIAEGVSSELDELRTIAFSGKDYLLRLQQKESERTNIPSLKVAFNNVFGYYIEITNAHKDKVPAEWVRKQTLVNAERYITEELKQYEEKILGAEDKILALETTLFNNLVAAVTEYIQPIQHNASLIAEMDCLLSFSRVALGNNYIKPEINESGIIDIKHGRHPVIEKKLRAGEEYIANDVYLDNETQQIMMITGPNMSGKSALLRQTALIVLMAQTGSFVPAAHATIGVIDKIFTRVGASDNISLGESTFMVEMNETASILNNISDRSLILLDEIGRGTSTYDGISIAWAIAEFIHNHTGARAKTLFATHYHELNEMAGMFPRIKNYNVSVKELDNRIIFLRKLAPGGSEHSFGIHVAKLAGMPVSVIRRANEILLQLEKSHSGKELSASSPESYSNMQLSFFQLDDPLLEQIREEIINTDINTLTPVEALMKLNGIRKLITRKQ